MTKKKISHWCIAGDSLTDRGEMAHRYLFGFISMDKLSGLFGYSLFGRFTDRFTWADHFLYLVIQKLKNQVNLNNKTNPKAEDLTETEDFKALESIEGDPLKAINQNTQVPVAKNIDVDDTVDQEISEDHEFDNYLYVKFDGHQDFARCYAEGGLTSHDYSWVPSKSITRFFSRLILSTLGEMRKRLLHWDREQDLKNKQKEQTLIIEWSGANDLITVNEKPSPVEAIQAVKDRIKNIKKLIKKGYQNFALFNLPDLSLTPRFQALAPADRKNASKSVYVFNEELKNRCKELKKLYPHCSIEIFDVNSQFKEAYKNPEKYGFKKDYITKNFCDSAKENKWKMDNPIAKEFMFWNDVHPSDRMHKLLAVAFKQQIEDKFELVLPSTVLHDSNQKTEFNLTEGQLLEAFKKEYASKLYKDTTGSFGFFRKSRMDYMSESLTLRDILKHAFYDNGNRTRSVMEHLQWFDHDGNLKLNIPVLKNIMETLIQEMSKVNEILDPRLQSAQY